MNRVNCIRLRKDKHVEKSDIFWIAIIDDSEFLDEGMLHPVRKGLELSYEREFLA